MKTLEELKEFYEHELIPELKRVDWLRLGILSILTFVALFFISLVVFLQIKHYPFTETGFFFILILFLAIIYVRMFLFFIQYYKKIFKTHIIGRLVHFIDPGLNHDPFKNISKGDFLKSQLFRGRTRLYKGSDLVYGKIQETNIQFSELRIEHETGIDEFAPFMGLFFIADFNKNFQSRVIVLPDRAEKLLGQYGTKFQSLNMTRPSLVKMEDIEFEREFVVYGDDPVETRYILSTNLMRQILAFKQNANQNIYLSFVDSKILVAIPSINHFFEPTYFSSMVNFEAIRKYFEDLQLAIGIVQDLNLNTRIWTKE